MDKILNLLDQYRSLELSTIVDYDKFNHYAITHHSTQLEGSTLTEIETNLLLDEGKTPKGKPLLHSLMVKDHYEALQFVLKESKKERAITLDFIQQINAEVLKSTGAKYNTPLGEVNGAEGEFRKGNVRAGNRYFATYDKVPALTTALCKKAQEALPLASHTEQQLNLSFDAHFDLVSIHPFYDGNGRTARLLMNYIQARFHLPLSIVFFEDKVDYIEALEQSRKQESLLPFREFMLEQYEKYLQVEIDRYLESKRPPKPGGGYSLVF